MKVKLVTTIKSKVGTKVYDATISGTHCLFVGEKGTLAHNTGRKLAVKHGHGGKARLGGGNDTGKTITGATDRIGLYAARYIAKNIVSADLADTAEVQLSYAIGISEPLSINFTLKGSKLTYSQLKQLEDIVRKEFPVKPVDIIREFGLVPKANASSVFDISDKFYSELAMWGPFTNPDAPWEQTDKASTLAKYFYSI